MLVSPRRPVSLIIAQQFVDLEDDLPGVRIIHNFGVSVVAAVLGLQRRELDERERRKVSPQTVVVVTFRHVPGFPRLTHTNSAPTESR
jgi:hypothetical protein